MTQAQQDAKQAWEAILGFTLDDSDILQWSEDVIEAEVRAQVDGE